MRRGADVNGKSREGEPPLILLITQIALIPLDPMETKELSGKERAEIRRDEAAKTKTALHCLDTLLARKPDLGSTLPSEMDWKGGNALAYARYYKLPAVVARLQKAGIKR